MEKGNGLKKITGSKLFQLLCIWVGLLIVFTAWAAAIGEKFLSVDTFLAIGDLMIVTSFLAIGAGCLMVAGHMDLSASAIGAFGCVFYASAMKYWQMNPVVAMILSLVMCTIFGLANGVLVNVFNCPSFISTMAMGFVAKGCSQWVSVSPDTGNPQSVNVSNEFTHAIAEGKLLGIKVTFIIAILAFIIYGIMLAKTKYGREIYLVGGNAQASRLAGINPKAKIYFLFANCGFLAGVSGVIYMGRASQGDLNALATNQFTGLTAALLGGISFGGGNGNMAGVFVGLMILNTFSKGMLVIRASTYWTTVLTGVLLLAALIIDTYSMKAKRKNLLKATR